MGGMLFVKYSVQITTVCLVMLSKDDSCERVCVCGPVDHHAGRVSLPAAPLSVVCLLVGLVNGQVYNKLLCCCCERRLCQ